MNLTYYPTPNPTQTKAWEREAARVRAARPQHTPATLASQRARINAWVKLWLESKSYRALAQDKAAALRMHLSEEDFRQQEVIRCPYVD
jgi:hypothetical protein